MKVSIELEEGESRDEADELLLKALGHQKTGEIHEADSFVDPVMEEAARELKDFHALIYKVMLEAIILELDR